MEESSDPMDTQREEDKVDYSGTDQGATKSDSSVSLSTKLKSIHEGKNTAGFSFTGNEEPTQRYSDRLAPKSDVPIMDRAKNLAKTKNLQADGGNLCTAVLNSSDSCILDIAELIGIDLGASLDMVQSNLGLLRGQEQARVNLFIESGRKTKEKECDTDVDQPTVVDDVLLQLLKMRDTECESLVDNFSGHLGGGRN